MAIDRPVLRYHGGKYKLAPWIVSHFAPHKAYVEPFGGAASVLMRKPRTKGEVYNDLDSDVVNVFRVLQDPDLAAELCKRLYLTPYAREEFKAAYNPGPRHVDRAAAMIVRSFMGFGSASMTRTHMTGFRSDSRRSGSTPGQDWANYPPQIQMFVERLRGVVIENREAVDVMEQHDGPDTLHYIDPPYVPSTRSSLQLKNGNSGHYYRHDMDEADHEALLDRLSGLEGMVVVSGYRCGLYDTILADWRRIDRRSMADGARERCESLWLNGQANEGCMQQPLFKVK